MAYQTGETDPGVGGLKLAVSKFTDTDAIERTLPLSGLAYGELTDIPVTVTEDVGLPVKLATDQGPVAVTGTFWQATQPVSIASVPSHAVTNAGVFAVQVSSALPAGTNVIGHVIVDSGAVAATQSGAWTVAATQSGAWTVTVTGVATAANQATEIASLASIDGKIPALGQALAAASVPVVLTADQISTLTPLATVSVTGVSTAANQATIISSLSSIDGHVDGVEGSLTSIDAKITACNTGAVVVASSALPTGAATAARQDTGNASLTSIDSKVPALGQALAAASVPIVLTASQLTTLTPPAAITGFATAANQTTELASLASIDGKITAVDTGAVTISAALPAGTNAIGKLAANSGVTIGAVEIVAGQTVATVTTVTTLTGGGVAHDAADSGNPHKIGAKATTSLSGLTLVADSDRTNLFAGIDGVQIFRPHCNLEDIVRGLAAITDGSSTSVIASQGSGIKIYITSVIIANSSASNLTVDLKDGTGGSVRATFPAPANCGGAITNLPVPLPFSADTAVAADPSAAASTITVTLIGFRSKI